jgi:2-amino-4-hydroxy-6-hydroxymethyldihydropteridine diphosphokinase
MIARSTAPTTAAYIALGSNLAWGEVPPVQMLVAAAKALCHIGVDITARSGVWSSPAWPEGIDAPKYSNAVVEVCMHSRTPQDMMRSVLAIERDLGRVRDPANRWAPRTIDIDLIDVHQMIVADGTFLQLPHPRARDRDFVLAPLLEIAPHWCWPGSGEAGAALLAAVRATPGHRPAVRIGNWGMQTADNSGVRES